MRIEDFQPLIAALPTGQHAFRSRLETWNGVLNIPQVGDALLRMFAGEDQLLISRNDISAVAANQDVMDVIVASIVWGYPRGMRGNNAVQIFDNIEPLSQVLEEAVDNGIDNWAEHWKKLDIPGLGISTYSKFLYFLGVEIAGIPALILDQRICEVSERQVFEELLPLQQLRYHNAPRRYPAYLKIMAELGGQYNLDPERLEQFLFLFGLNLNGDGA